MTAFDDLLAANREFAATFKGGDFDGVARAGVAIVTCMDSRIDPLRMLGLQLRRRQDLPQPRWPGLPRRPGGARRSRVHLLGVTRVLVVPHTRCAMAQGSEAELRERIGASAGVDASWQPFHVIADQLAALAEDVRKVTSHPLIPDSVAVGGFLYDVDTGLIERHV